MITVHHLNNSRSQRVLWLLEELGLDYTVVRYQRDPETLLAPPSLPNSHKTTMIRQRVASMEVAFVDVRSGRMMQDVHTVIGCANDGAAAAENL